MSKDEQIAALKDALKKVAFRADGHCYWCTYTNYLWDERLEGDYCNCGDWRRYITQLLNES